eukprot:scaffold56907_cov38-Cyclotella_meneghiniana.AAC.2
MLFSIKSTMLASVAEFAALIHNIGTVNSQEVVKSVIDASAYHRALTPPHEPNRPYHPQRGRIWPA